MSDFVVFTKDDFERGFLEKYKYIDYTSLIAIPGSKEYVYYYSPPIIKNIGIYIYSSVSIYDDRSRENGADAIRSILFDPISKKGIGKETRTHRIAGWKERLSLKIQNLEKQAQDLKFCPRCNSVMIRRNGQYGEFFGCLSYPKCNGKPKEITIKDVHREIFMKITSGQIIDFDSIEKIAKTNEKQAFIQLIKRNDQLTNRFRMELRRDDKKGKKEESIKKIISLMLQQSLLKTLTEEQRTIFWKKLGHGWTTINPILIDQALGLAKIKKI